ncbi:UvrD-helicase domain-containing protein [Streptomyces sp. NPDC005438]|uniref:UvrD-helicase domain-containing protein n=1 Tax=Streptomyces sp. NPDC005438 TaxID=3156880 RepID=UPI0033A67F7F
MPYEGERTRAGASAARQARQARDQERRLWREWRAARGRADRWERASEGERRVAAHLLWLEERGWRLLVDRRWPGTRAANVDMLLVGPGGVFVVDVKNWRAQPTVEDGHLVSAGERRDHELEKLLAVTRATRRCLDGLGLSPVAVQPLMAFAGREWDTRLDGVRLLGERQLAPTLSREPRRLTAPLVRLITEHLEHSFPAYEDSGPGPEPSEEAGPLVEEESLFTLDALRDAALAEARRQPIERWMTFLHSDQNALVRRDWSGPARISGPAGTGKTVVGLHRAAYLATRTPGRVLYVTHARNLPRVQATLLATMAPSVADRVDFHSLHAWAMEFLHQHERPVRIHKAKADTAFHRAWGEWGRGSCLDEIDTGPRYWEEEREYVIKGRGLTHFAQYAAVERRRRRAPMAERHRRRMWKLYEEYERRRTEAGVHDFQDVLSLAGQLLREDPSRSPYEAVIVDEVQDLTLVGLRLLHSLVGDRPNGLLLIGDGQQAVYPGGFRLSEAGVDARGRGQTLSINYRNAREVLDAALEVVAQDPYEDLDGEPAGGRREVHLTYEEGRVVRAEAEDDAAHDRALLEALEELRGREGWADSALLCPDKRSLDRYGRLLHQADIPVCPLERYDGRPDEGLKLGTYVRAKGLEFKRVYLPRHDAALTEARQTTDAQLARERGQLGRSQLFVAMTRARDLLWLGSVTR